VVAAGELVHEHDQGKAEANGRQKTRDQQHEYQRDARFALRRRLWAAALLEFPVAGTYRTDLIAGLFAGYTPN